MVAELVRNTAVSGTLVSGARGRVNTESTEDTEKTSR